MEEFIYEKQGPLAPTLWGELQAGQSVLPRGKGRLPVRGELCQVGLSVTRETSRVAHFTLPWSKQSLVGAWGKYTGSSAKWLQWGAAGTVKKGMDRQENCHLEWPGPYTLLICPVLIFIISPDPRIQRRRHVLLLIIVLNIAMLIS